MCKYCDIVRYQIFSEMDLHRCAQSAAAAVFFAIEPNAPEKNNYSQQRSFLVTSMYSK